MLELDWDEVKEAKSGIANVGTGERSRSGGEERETGVGRRRDERMKAEVDAAERV